MTSITDITGLRPSSPIGRAWAHFAGMMKETTEAYNAYDRARDESVEAAIVSHDLDFEQAQVECGVEPARQAEVRATANLAEARVALVVAYRTEFGEDGVRRLEAFLSAIQRFGGVHPLVKVGSFGTRSTLPEAKIDGPATIHLAGAQLAELWIDA